MFNVAIFNTEFFMLLGVTVGISIAVVILILALGTLVGWLIYRRIIRK